MNKIEENECAIKPQSAGVTKLYIMQKLFSIKAKEGENIIEHLLKLN